MFEPPLNNHDGMSTFDTLAYSLINFGLSVFYLLLIIVGIIQFTKRYSHIFPFYKSSYMFLISLSVLAFLHLGYLSMRTVNLFWMHKCIPSTFVFSFDTLPGLLMYATFIALLIFWGDIYVGYYDQQSLEVTPLLLGKPQKSFITVESVKKFIVGIIVFVILSILALFSVFAAVNGLRCSRGEPLLEPIIVYGIAFIYFTSVPIAVVIGFFGYRIYKEAIEDRVLTGLTYNDKISKLRKVAFVAFICVLCFVLRGCALVLEWHRQALKTFYTDGIYYFFLDLFPLFLMIVLLLSPPFRPGNNFAAMNRMGLY